MRVLLAGFAGGATIQNDGALDIRGMRDQAYVPSVPIEINLVLVMKLAFEAKDLQSELSGVLTIFTPEGKKLADLGIKFQYVADQSDELRLTTPYVQELTLPFREFGQYECKFIAEGVEQASFPFSVLQTKP